MDIFDEYTAAAKEHEGVESSSAPDESFVRADSVVIGTNADGTPKTSRYPGAFSSTKNSPYENSELAQSELAKQAASGEDALYNDRQPFYEIKHQKPEHRIIIFLKAEGHTNKEIATVTGMTTVAISNILRQPWARKQLADEINKAGRNEVATLFKSAAPDAAQILIDIANNAENRPSDRIAAADKVLDRVFGKATQPILELGMDDLKSKSDEELYRIASGQRN